MYGSVGVDRRINQRAWEQEDWVRKTYIKNSPQVIGYKMLYPFLMPDGENLGGFSQMGFHITSFVEWFINVECLCECQVFTYYMLTRYYWMCGTILLISEWIIVKALFEYVSKFIVNFLS